MDGDGHGTTTRARMALVTVAISRVFMGFLALRGAKMRCAAMRKGAARCGEKRGGARRKVAKRSYPTAPICWANRRIVIPTGSALASGLAAVTCLSVVMWRTSAIALTSA